MLTEVNLYGDLAAKYGDTLTFDIATPMEALQALEANHQGVLGEIRDGHYVLILGDKDQGEMVDKDRALLPKGSEPVHIVPVTQGEWAQVGAVLLDVLIYAAVAYAITYLIMQSIPDPESEEDKNNPSYYFDGPINTTRQGNVVPVCYGGPLLIGSQVVSAAMRAEDIPLDWEPPEEA